MRTKLNSASKVQLPGSILLSDMGTVNMRRIRVLWREVKIRRPVAG
jgi:hypothetical protein